MGFYCLNIQFLINTSLCVFLDWLPKYAKNVVPRNIGPVKQYFWFVCVYAFHHSQELFMSWCFMYSWIEPVFSKGTCKVSFSRTQHSSSSGSWKKFECKIVFLSLSFSLNMTVFWGLKSRLIWVPTAKCFGSEIKEKYVFNYTFMEAWVTIYEGLNNGHTIMAILNGRFSSRTNYIPP